MVETPILAPRRGLNPAAPSPGSLQEGRREGTRVQDVAQRLPVSGGTHPQRARGSSKRDGIGASGTGCGIQPQAPRRPRIGKPGRAAGMLPPFLRAQHPAAPVG